MTPYINRSPMFHRLLRTCFAMLVAGCLANVKTHAAPAFDQSPGGGGLLLDDLDGLLESLPEEAEPMRPQGAGEDLGAKPESPLAKIETGMATAQQLIAERGKPVATNRVQKQVIADLDELIKQAEKQCQQCKNGSSGSSGKQAKQKSQRSKPKPGQEQPSQQQGSQTASQSRAQQSGQQSTDRLESADSQAAAGRPPADVMKEVWGRLPQRLREQMLESSSDEFLPEYREEIEQYFRRLAEQPTE
ncbi:MAG: hypothetical protein AAGF31_02860 [Planctomycetota bacterium]